MDFPVRSAVHRPGRLQNGPGSPFYKFFKLETSTLNPTPPELPAKPAAPALPAAVPLEQKLADFPSRLSPVLVKELRQGLRTNLFVIAFILLQTFMILCLLAGLANPGSNDSNGFFWFFIAATLLIIQPLRGFNALSGEYQLNTMDLIQLTRLNGWRITLGKWTALNAQGLLFLVGVLPYLVIRYFIGNVNLVTDIAALGCVGLASGLLTAITIGCSVFKSIILRGILLFVLAILAVSAFAAVGNSVFGRYGRAPDATLGIMLAVTAVYGILFFLSFGASRIAPLSENQATRKRLIAIGFALLFQVFYFFDAEEAVISITGVILGLACIDALTEPLPVFGRVCTPFRNNLLLRWPGVFLCPGWISGIFFFIFCSALWWGSAVLYGAVTGDAFLDQIEDVVVFASMANLIIFPLLIMHLFFARYSSMNHTFGIYLFTQAALFGITLMVMAIANALRHWEEIAYLAVPIPSVFIAAGMDGNDVDEPVHLIIVVLIFALCVSFPLLRQFRSVRAFLSALVKSPD